MRVSEIYKSLLARYPVMPGLSQKEEAEYKAYALRIARETAEELKAVEAPRRELEGRIRTMALRETTSSIYFQKRAS